MPRHHALLAILAALLIGIILGATGFHLAGRPTATVDDLLEERKLLLQMNAELKAKLAEIPLAVKQRERTEGDIEKGMKIDELERQQRGEQLIQDP